MTDDWRDARTMGVSDDEIIHLTNIARKALARAALAGEDAAR